MWTIERTRTGIGILLVAAGCVTSAPSQALLEARQMREKAHESRAAELAPAHVRNADQVMARAEAQVANSEEEKQLAYIASAKYETAIGEARRRDALVREEVAQNRFLTEQARMRSESQAKIAEVKKDYEHVKSLLDSTQAELDAVQQRLEEQRLEGEEKSMVVELESQRKALDEQVQILDAKRVMLEAELAERDAKLEVEREARMDAEEKAQSALKKLNDIASVRQDEEGTVITLTGSVLFASGESVLLPQSRERLKMVADALKAQDDEVGIVIEGHTDSKGSDVKNDELSYARAMAVKEYLVEQGVDTERIRAFGRGEKEPVATNETPEGRANNRRVEIILNKET